MKVYVGTALKRVPDCNEVQELFKAKGHEISYDWTAGVIPLDERSPAYLAECSMEEVEAIRVSDAVVMLLPGGRGTHVEIGLALALRKPLYLAAASARYFAQEHASAFYYHPGVRMWAHTDYEDLVNLVCMDFETPRGGQDD